MTEGVGHVHHWRLATPEGGKRFVLGECMGCGAQKRFLAGHNDEGRGLSMTDEAGGRRSARLGLEGSK